jgi:hypothetical protein
VGATREEYIAFMKTQLGGYGPAKGLANNDNKFNTWYYGRRVSGNNYAWCSVAECYCENHFDILKLNGGKIAYVPNMAGLAQNIGAQTWHRPRSVPKQGTSWAKPGNKIVFAFTAGSSGSHTGTFVRRISDTVIETYEANTETSRWSDAFAPKQRSVSSILWVIETLGLDDAASGGNEEEDVLKLLLDLGSEGKPLTIKAGKRDSLTFEKEYSDGDPSKIHKDADKDGAYPSIFPVGKKAAFAHTVEVVLKDVPEDGVWICVSEYERETNKFIRDIRSVPMKADRDVLTALVPMSEDFKYRADVVNKSGKDIQVDNRYWIVAH